MSKKKVVITEAMIAKQMLVNAYMEDPDTCPHCGSQIEGTDSDHDWKTITRKTRCSKCHAEFVEEFTMTKVEIK